MGAFLIFCQTGTPTVRAIVLDHGGNIELRNRREGGLRVTVQLPLPEQ